MTAKEINTKALLELSDGNLREAQLLFFENAKKHPSHQTYNNLGFYLITEGLMRKNGKTINALKLGTKYLKKSYEISRSAINIFAIVTSINYQLKFLKENEKKALYQEAYYYLTEANKYVNSDYTKYNLLRFLYLLRYDNKRCIEQSKHLVKNNTNDETVALYFNILCKNSLFTEGNLCIQKYGQFIKSDDLLVFYAKSKQYEKGVAISQEVIKDYEMTNSIIAAIIECYNNTNRVEELQAYINSINKENSIHPFLSNKALKLMLGNSAFSIDYRRKNIESHIFYLPYLDQCCYFGCSAHNTPW